MACGHRFLLRGGAASAVNAEAAQSPSPLSRRSGPYPVNIRPRSCV